MVKKEISEISLDGGLLCLDFINTVSNRTADNCQEYLTDIFDLIAWAKRLTIIDAKTERLLSKKSIAHPKEATAFFKEVIEFREILYEIMRAHIKKKKIHPDFLGKYNALLKSYFQAIEIKQSPDGFIESWLFEEDHLKKLVAPVLNDSYELLLSDKLVKVKECSNCKWLFYDRTKNGKRRWCSMKSCGSNVKALKWYHRQKGSAL